MKMIKIILFIMAVLLCFSIVMAIPNIEYYRPTPYNLASQTQTYVQLNSTIYEQNITQLVYLWNNTNYTYYSPNTVLFLNFNNLTELGEDNTHIRELSLYNQTYNYTSGNTTIQNGKYLNSMAFDGTNDQITFEDSTSLSITDEITMAVWVYLFEASSWRSIICKQAQASHASPYCNYGLFRSSDTTKWTIRINTASNNFGTVVYGQWVHLACSWSSLTTTVNCYEDGQLVFTNVDYIDQPDDSIYPLRIGASKAGEYFKGYMDDLIILNVSLSENEIQQLYFSSINRYNNTYWNYYVNQSMNKTVGLPTGKYNYSFYVSDNIGNDAHTEKRTIEIKQTVTSCDVPVYGQWNINAVELCNFTFPVKYPNNIEVNGSGIVNHFKKYITAPGYTTIIKGGAKVYN